MSLIQRIDALLPQTQCGKCGHPGCRPYAEGLAAGEAINKCPPGGRETIAALAELLQVPVIAPDTTRGQAPAQVAYIREAECIGCTKCIQACPVDAIVGATKLMHTVIASECTGCDLCLPACPVDCIDMRPLPDNVVPIVDGLARTDEQRQARSQRRNQARQRHERRKARLHREVVRRQAERDARQHQATFISASDAALKQAKMAVAISQAQLGKARNALGATPDATQLAQLQALETATEHARKHLEELQGHASA
ncbi:electron transport complex subunit RsxB [Pseudomonas entomophila]|uniref:electron transport complex subunit RsxB n=1 Tax=Pseudomonas entomophila TaxID=312306 RepID=UPI003D300F3A